MSVRIIGRIALVGVMLLLVGAGWLVHWIHRTQRDWEAHVTTGHALVESLGRFRDAFRGQDRRALAALFDPAFDDRYGPVWTAGSPERRAGIEIRDWRSSPQEPSGREAWIDRFQGWSRASPWMDEVRFQLEWIDDRPEPDRAQARFLIHLRGSGLDGCLGSDQAEFQGSFRSTAQGWKLLGLRLIRGCSVRGAGDHFEEVAPARGLEYVLEPDPRLVPGGAIPLRYQVIRHAYAGAVAADYDADGFEDVLLMGGGGVALFRNTGDGSFREATTPAGLAGMRGIQTALLTDFDRDGVPDLLLARYYGGNTLLRGTGDGTFVVVDPGPVGPVECVSCMSAADFDGDGRLDLYLGRFLEARERIPDTYLYARNGPRNRMFRGREGLAFEDITGLSGTGDHGLTASVSAADYDRDGHVDLWCVNDYGRNVLYRGRGDGRFDDVTGPSGTLDIDAGMSAMFADYDNDSWLDFYVSGIHGNQRWFAHPLTSRRFLARTLENRLLGRGGRRNDVWKDLIAHFGGRWDQVGQMSLSGNNLWRNRGDGTFERRSDRAGVNPPGWFWSSGFFDIDNDGFKDILAVNGWISGDSSLELDFSGETSSDRSYDEGHAFSDGFVAGSSWHGNERDVLLLNRGDGTFVEAGAALGIDSIRDGRGIAPGDFDHDGDIDFVISHYDRPAEYYLNRQGQDGHWIAIELVGTHSHREGIGAQVVLRSGDLVTAGNVAAGEGYACQYPRVLHFGLGPRGTVDRLEVHWPGAGPVQVVGPVPADRRIRIVQEDS